MFTALVAGHVCLDLIPELPRPADLTPGALAEIGPMRLGPGGCVANTGGDLLALGATARLVADVGDDELGRVLRDMLAARDGAASCLRVAQGRTTSYSVVVQPPGSDRVFWHHVGANGQFDGCQLDVTTADLLHVGYPPILPALSARGGGPLRALLSRARSAGLTTSADFAVVDRSTPAGRQDWAAILRRTLPLTDVFTPSVDDLASALDRRLGTTPEALAELAARLVSAGAAVVALTAGADGMLLRTAGAGRLGSGGRVLASLSDAWADRELWVPPLPVRVTSTLGAGDAATAGLLYGLLAGFGPEDAALTAAGAAAIRISTSGRLPRYAESGIGASRAGGADRPGWGRGERGVFTGPSDGSSSGQEDRSSSGQEDRLPPGPGGGSGAEPRQRPEGATGARTAGGAA